MISYMSHVPLLVLVIWIEQKLLALPSDLLFGMSRGFLFSAWCVLQGRIDAVITCF